MTKGWIQLHRQLQEHWLWQSKPFSYGQAYIDLILSANHTSAKIVIGSRIENIKRGQLITSVRKLSDKWGWSKDKTLKFLRLLESDGMIDRNADTNRTLITLVNYEKYQGRQDSNQDATKDSNQDTTSPLTIIREKDNNVNNKYKGLEARLFGEVDKQLEEGGFN